jgi:hypothetical protein
MTFLRHVLAGFLLGTLRFFWAVAWAWVLWCCWNAITRWRQ